MFINKLKFKYKILTIFYLYPVRFHLIKLLSSCHFPFRLYVTYAILFFSLLGPYIFHPIFLIFIRQFLSHHPYCSLSSPSVERLNCFFTHINYFSSYRKVMVWRVVLKFVRVVLRAQVTRGAIVIDYLNNFRLRYNYFYIL